MESACTIGLAAVDPTATSRHEAIRVPGIHCQGVKGASGPENAIGKCLWRVPGGATIQRDNRTNAEIGATSAFPRADKDPVRVGWIDGDRPNRQRVCAQRAQTKRV